CKPLRLCGALPARRLPASRCLPLVDVGCPPHPRPLLPHGPGKRAVLRELPGRTARRPAEPFSDLSAGEQLVRNAVARRRRGPPSNHAVQSGPLRHVWPDPQLEPATLTDAANRRREVSLLRPVPNRGRI